MTALAKEENMNYYQHLLSALVLLMLSDRLLSLKASLKQVVKMQTVHTRNEIQIFSKSQIWKETFVFLIAHEEGRWRNKLIFDLESLSLIMGIL